ncbi:MAG: T9SS type A sorting domain-containing protein [Hymenobacter sp.]|nr:MAG: T9SS type A sorting domain-containing protein [Hymenobacter sp.]
MQVTLRIVQFLGVLLLGFGLVLPSYAQAPAWLSATTLGQREFPPYYATSTTKVVVATAPDGQGNLYVTGYFAGTVAFGATTLVSTIIPGYADIYSTDIFVAKWSLADNRYLWATSASGGGSEGGSQLVVSGANLYIAGTTYFKQSQAGSLRFGTTTLPTGTGYSIFVAKLTDTGTSGVWKWGKTGNNEYLASVNGLAVNGSTVYLAGNLCGTMTFDGKTVRSNQSLAYNAGDLLLAKFTDAGTSATVNWVQVAGSATYEYTDALAVSGTTLYVAGSYFNTSTIGTTTMPNTGKDTSTDAFITKFSDTGTTATPVWTQHLGGTSSDRVGSLVASGNTVYAVGHFYSPSLELGTPVTTTLTNQDPAGTSDLFLAKLVDAGTSSSFAWIQQAGGIGSEQAAHLVRAGNALFVTGTFSGATATFGRTVLTNATAAGGVQDLYVARFNETPTGATLAWAQQAGSTSYDYAYSLNLLGNRLYLAGFSNEAATFGAFTLPQSSSYLASLGADAPLSAAGTTSLPAFTLYPNPARTTLTVQVPAIAGATQAVLTLHDALGRVVQTTAWTPPAAGLTHQLSVTGLARGIYLLRLQASTTVAVRQVMIE